MFQQSLRLEEKYQGSVIKFKGSANSVKEANDLSVIQSFRQITCVTWRRTHRLL